MPAPKYSVGQVVIFINYAGVNWGPVTITEVVDDPDRGWTYFYTPTETPWYSTKEEHLYDPADQDTIDAATKILGCTHPLAVKD